MTNKNFLLNVILRLLTAFTKKLCWVFLLRLYYLKLFCHLSQVLFYHAFLNYCKRTVDSFPKLFSISNFRDIQVSFSIWIGLNSTSFSFLYAVWLASVLFFQKLFHSLDRVIISFLRILFRKRSCFAISYHFFTGAWIY